MVKFHQTKKFKRLNSLWLRKLARSGFIDIETASGALKNYDRRTIAWENRQRIETFFRALDSFLIEAKLPAKDKKILELYSQGIRIAEISVRSGMNRFAIHKLIQQYKRQVLESET
jgi:hypothetical protein